MGFVGIGLAVVAFLISQSVLMDYVPESYPFWPISLVIAAWVAWPFFRLFKEEMFSTLSPRARLHNLPVAQAFSKIIQVFDENLIKERKFEVYVRDTTARRICARLNWTETTTNFTGHGNSPTSIHLTSEPVQTNQILEVEIRLKPEQDKTVMIMDWKPIAGRLKCNEVIDQTTASIYKAIGDGEVYESEKPRTYLAGPPLALVVASVIACFVFLAGINKKIDQQKAKYEERKTAITKVDSDESLRREEMKKEVQAWDSFKSRRGI